MLILLRHGQTEANARGVLLGRSDPDLTDTGREQALAARAAVPESARVISSPLRRAYETAGIAAPGRAVEVDSRWIEVSYGEYEEKKLSDLPPDEVAAWRADPHFRPPGGESLHDVGVRVRDAICDIVVAARDGDVVVVSHVSPIKCALVWALGVGDETAWRMYLSVASISRLSFGRDPGDASVVSMNDTAHLTAKP